MATATIQVAYEAETSSLKATVNEINQINDKVVEGAQESAKKVKGFFANIANSFNAAFSGGEAKKALDNQAKAIDNLGKSGKSLTGQLRGLKQELAALEAAGQDGTDAFNKLLISAARLEDQIGDTRDRVRILASDTFKFDAAVGATQALASGFEVAQGAAALFGSESEDLQKSLLKVQAAIAVANGVQQIAALVTEQSAVKTAVLTAAQATYTTVVGTSTGALKVFRLALAATGVGALVIGLVALYENFDKVKQFAYNAIPGLESFATGVGKVVDAAKKLVGIEDPKKTEDKVAKLIEAETRRVQAQESAIARRINLLKAENKDTAALEIQREQLLLDFANKKVAAVKQASAAAAAAGIDTGKVLFDLSQEILDRENAIQVLRIQNARTTTKEIEKLESIGFKAAINRKEEELKLNTTVSTAYRDQLQKDNAERIAVLELEKSINGESLQNTIDTINARAKAEADALGLTQADSLKRQKIFTDAEKAITEATNAEFEKRQDLINKFVQQTTQAFAALNELSKVANEIRLQEIQDVSDKELEAINQSTLLERDKVQSRIALEKKKAAQIAEINRRQAVQDKALAIFNIGLSTSQAIMQFLVKPGGAAGIALSVLAGITGAAEIAAVIAKPIPKFERGGLIGGRLHSQGGTLIEAEQGEYMVNRRQSAKHRRELDAMNTSTEAFRRMIDEKYVRPALMSYSAGRRGKEGVIVNASLNSKSMEKEMRGMRKDLKNRNVIVNINQQDSRYQWQ
jgi:hypothetical protein